MIPSIQNGPFPANQQGVYVLPDQPAHLRSVQGEFGKQHNITGNTCANINPGDCNWNQLGAVINFDKTA